LIGVGEAASGVQAGGEGQDLFAVFAHQGKRCSAKFRMPSTT
jgi:hypothetical protein